MSAHRALFAETLFIYADFPMDYPTDFAIITAYPTTGESWSSEKLAAQVQAFEAELRALGYRMHAVTGTSGDLSHQEPGWAVVLPPASALALAIAYHQWAYFSVSAQQLTLIPALAEWDALPLGDWPSRRR